MKVFDMKYLRRHLEVNVMNGIEIRTYCKRKMWTQGDYVRMSGPECSKGI